MNVEQRAARVRALFLDVDGTLTDGRIYLFPSGVVRAFHTLDGMYIAYISVRCYLNPALGPALPPDERLTSREKLRLLKNLGAPIALIAIVLGIIFTGVATPVEAAGVGSFGAIVVSAIHGRLTLANMRAAAVSTLKVTGMVLWIIFGANPTVNHPVAATMMKNAAARGTRLIVADPRRSELAAHAEITMQMKPDSDVALLNAMMHVIITENLTDEEFIRSRTKDFELLRAQALTCPPEKMEDICGIPAEEIRQAARLYGTAERAMIFWGMGVSQHTHGTDNARCLIALAMMTGNIGRPGCGLHPLRGQNNVQGASDAGLIPMMFPDYQRVDDESARKRFEELWGMPLDNKPGLTVVEVIDAACQGEICGMYVMGENPAMSDPDAAHARQGLASLQMLVVQDIFLTETAALADVVLPASVFVEKTGTFTNTDRMVQLGRRALDVPGLARQDLWIIQQIARRLDLKWKYRGENSGVRRVFEEMRRAMPSIAGITWERLQSEHSVTYPCRAVGDAGEPIIFTEKFPTTDGLGRFVPAAFSPAAERPDADYPLVLITGRELEHWHTGAMTRRTRVLDALEPAPTVYINPQELSSAQLQAGDTVTVRSRRGAVSLTARGDGGVPRGAVFIPFCYYEAAANMLTNPVLDPDGKIPEFKYCAVKVEKGGEPTVALSFGGGVAAH
jgi:formate dehydrogenase major subunit